MSVEVPLETTESFAALVDMMNASAYGARALTSTRSNKRIHKTQGPNDLDEGYRWIYCTGQGGRKTTRWNNLQKINAHYRGPIRLPSGCGRSKRVRIVERNKVQAEGEDEGKGEKEIVIVYL